MRTVAALYIDPRGPYPKMPGVECWDEARDARNYAGPHPVVAHPPCGPWGDMAHLCKSQPRDLAPRAVEQVQLWGGVLEHPARSRLWAWMGLPGPDDATDSHGGRTFAVEQCDWGHKCRKPTWLYVVGSDQARLMARLRRRRGTGAPTHAIFYGDWERSGHAGAKLLAASKEIRRRTPPEFAELLVGLARESRRREAA
jgi:hypothetical protein